MKGHPAATLCLLALAACKDSTGAGTIPYLGVMANGYASAVVSLLLPSSSQDFAVTGTITGRDSSGTWSYPFAGSFSWALGTLTGTTMRGAGNDAVSSWSWRASASDCPA